ncbi:MAG: NHL repeat-containing protein [Planctomycetota bacterium]
MEQEKIVSQRTRQNIGKMYIKKIYMVNIVLVCVMAFATMASSIIYPNNVMHPRGSLVDKNGNLFFVGNAHDIDTGYDFVTMKWDKEGKKVWERRFNSPWNVDESSEAFTVDNQGNVYVTGDSIDHEKKIRRYATVKYDNSGNEVWTAFYKEPKDELLRIAGTAVDNKDNVYITAPIEVQIPDTTSFIDKYRYSLIIKYDSQGKLSWFRKYGESENYEIIEPKSIVVDDSGHVYILSYLIGKKTGSWSDEESNNYFATVKHDTYGKHQWTVLYAADANSANSPENMVCDNAGNVYVVGSSEDWDSSYEDLITIKYNKDGKQQWIARYRIPNQEEIAYSDIALDKVSNVYVTCNINVYESPIDWDDPNIDYREISPLKTEFATIKYNTEGKQQWFKRYHIEEGQEAWIEDIMVDSKGNIYLKGYISNGSWKNYASYEELESEEGERYFILVRYDTNGNEKWMKKLYNMDELAKLLSQTSFSWKE